MCVIKIHAFTSIGRPPSWSGTPPLTWDTLEVDAIWIVSEIDNRKDEDLDTMEEDENVMEEDYSMIDDL